MYWFPYVMNSQSNEMATLKISPHVCGHSNNEIIYQCLLYLLNNAFLVALSSLSARLFILFLAESTVTASTLPCLAPTLIKALASLSKPFPSIAENGLKSSATNATVAFAISSLQDVEIGFKLETKLVIVACVKGLLWEVPGWLWSAFFLLGHRSMCRCRWLVPLVARSCFKAWLQSLRRTYPVYCSSWKTCKNIF